MSGKYIDQTGLARILTNLKANFATKSAATTSADGLMSAADKTKLDGLSAASNAVVYCDSPSGANSKGCEQENFTHEEGVYFALIFENGNDHLNLSSLPIQLVFNDLELTVTLYINGVISSGTNCTYDAGTYLAYDDGTNIHIRTDGLIPTFSGSGSSASYMSDQEVIDILNDNEEAWTGLEKVKVLWQNASPASNFAAQTVTLSESMSNFDLIIIYALNYHEESSAVQPFSLPSIMHYGLGPNSCMMFSRRGGSTDSVFRMVILESETVVSFSAGTRNTSTDNGYLVPYAILGINL